MMSLSSQYLHPEYLQPLPTTLDAKKSPLALLAQTCSSIGKDPTPSKSLIPPLDKKEKEAADKSSSDDKRPSSLGSKGSSSESGRDSSSKPGFRTIPPKDIPPLVPINGEKNGDNNSSKSSASSSSSSSSSETNSLATSASSASSSHNVLSSSNQRPVSATGSNSQRSSSRSGSARDAAGYTTPPASSSSSSLTRHSASASPPSSKISSAPPGSLSHASLSSMLPKPSVTHPSYLQGLGSHPLAAAYPHLSLLPGLDPALQSYHNALAAHSLSAAAAAAQSAAALKGGPSAMSPFVAYARVRTPSGATTLVPVCRDPFCSNCQLTLQNSHLSSACTSPGCSQCAHEKSLISLTTGSLAGLGSGSLSILPPISSASSLSGLSALHSPLYPLAAHQTSALVCSWVSGSEYCGKRFSNAEELLQHLRTHTTSLASSAEASSLAYSALGLHPSLMAAAAAGGHHYPVSSLSPNSLRRGYPQSLSPVSALLGRFHPYKSPLGAVPPPAPSAQGLPTVGPYYSPYALYSQRIGAAAVP